MKHIIIGRGINSDVVIPDESDLVSRKHCTLSYSFFGKMTITDNSTNGTFINGVRITSATPVKRNDVVSLAQAWTLDWDTIKDPYRFQKITMGILCFILFLILGGTGYWYINNKDNIPVIPNDTITVVSDSLKNDTILINDSNSTANKTIVNKHKKPQKNKNHEKKQKNKDTGNKRRDEATFHGKKAKVEDNNKNIVTPTIPKSDKKEVEKISPQPDRSKSERKNTPIIY